MAQDFSRRSDQAELMDDPAIGAADFHACLRDLEKVNRLTFAYRPLAHWLRQIAARPDCAGGVCILDAGCGGGDGLRFAAGALERWRVPADLVGIDLNENARTYAEGRTAASAPIRFVTGDIFAHAPARPIDFVMCALFTHHLTDAQLVDFLRWMERTARKGWFVSDLHRYALPFYGFRLLARLFGFHYMVQHDGPVSIARAFTARDWVRLLDAAGIPRAAVSIDWRFPFRYCLTRHRDA